MSHSFLQLQPQSTPSFNFNLRALRNKSSPVFSSLASKLRSTSSRPQWPSDRLPVEHIAEPSKPREYSMPTCIDESQYKTTPSFDAEYTAGLKYTMPQFSMPEYEPARPSSVFESGVPRTRHALEEPEESKLPSSNVLNQAFSSSTIIEEGTAPRHALEDAFVSVLTSPAEHSQPSHKRKWHLLATSRSLLRLSTKSSECLKMSRTAPSAHQLEPEELSPISPPFPRTPSPDPSGRFAAAQLHIVDPSRLAFAYDDGASLTSPIISTPEPRTVKPFKPAYSVEEEVSTEGEFEQDATALFDLNSDWTLALGADVGLPDVPMPSLPQRSEPRRRLLSDSQFLRPPQPQTKGRTKQVQRFSSFVVPAPEPAHSEWTLSLPLHQPSDDSTSVPSSSTSNSPSVPRVVVETEQSVKPKISMEENLRPVPPSRSRKLSNAQREARIPREVCCDLGISSAGANNDCAVTPNPSPPPSPRSVLDAVESDFETSGVSDWENELFEKRLALAGKPIIHSLSMRAGKC